MGLIGIVNLPSRVLPSLEFALICPDIVLPVLSISVMVKVPESKISPLEASAQPNTMMPGLLDCGFPFQGPRVYDPQYHLHDYSFPVLLPNASINVFTVFLSGSSNCSSSMINGINDLSRI